MTAITIDADHLVTLLIAGCAADCRFYCYVGAEGYPDHLTAAWRALDEALPTRALDTYLYLAGEGEADKLICDDCLNRIVERSPSIAAFRAMAAEASIAARAAS